MLTYCFESTYIPRTLAKCKKKDLAVVDTEGHTLAVRDAVKRGVWVYGYLNIGALEKERPYYEKLKHLRLAKYEGWDGEYWIDPTAQEWQEHILSLAKEIKATGAIGLYLDNTDIYYEIAEKQIRKQYSRNLPSAQAAYTALSNMILKINALGLIVMPNGGDVFVKKFITAQAIQDAHNTGVKAIGWCVTYTSFGYTEETAKAEILRCINAGIDGMTIDQWTCANLVSDTYGI